MALSAADLQRMRAQDAGSYSALTKSGSSFFPSATKPNREQRDRASFLEAATSLTALHESRTAGQSTECQIRYPGSISKNPTFLQMLSDLKKVGINAVPTPLANIVSHLPKPQL